jgi:hypothetical protein
MLIKLRTVYFNNPAEFNSFLLKFKEIFLTEFEPIRIYLIYAPFYRFKMNWSRNKYFRAHKPVDRLSLRVKII